MAAETLAGPQAMTARRALAELCGFFGLTFAVSWSLFAILALAPAWATSTFGQIHTPDGMVGVRSPLWYLAVYTPGFTAVVLTGLLHGKAGLGALLRRYVRNFGWGWALAALLIFPVTAILARATGDGLSLSYQAPELLAKYLLIVVSLRIVFDPGPVGEEIGWRGFALSRLLRLMPPFWAAIILGAIWAVWHLNMFLSASDGSLPFSFGQFAWGAIAATILMTWLYVRAGANLLICGVIPHLGLNAMLASGISLLESATLWGFTVVALAIAVFEPSMRPFRAAPLPVRASDPEAA